MKDLEKIKSEDLGCQVADANPGNFGIEQEVAAMVGATVPAPTEPSADDARELGAQLLVFLRRALLPIQSALRTALADIYAHLDSRCTDYTPAAYAPFRILPYDPMTTPRVPRTLPNLLQAITAFDSRKISNGSATNDGIPDGVSLVNLLCGNDNAATFLKDDNRGWTMKNDGLTSLLAMLPAVTKAEVWCEYAEKSILSSRPTIKELYMPYIKRVGSYGDEYIWYNIAYGCADLEKIDMPLLEEWYPGYDGGLGTNSTKLTEINLPHLRTVRARWWQYRRSDHCMYGATNLEKIVVGTPTNYFDLFSGTNNMNGCDKLIDIDICADGGACAMSLNMSQWNPTNVLSDADKTATFLQNFKEHIALRLTDQGSGLTLTLSQAVFDTIWKNQTSEQPQDNPIAQQIHQIIRVQKHWAVNRA